jgi:hypothetical protein
MTKSRISITIPEELLEAADLRAKELRRSRSWVLGDALRSYLATPAPSAVREPPAAYVAGPTGSRLEQLQADLALTPKERVALAQETVLVSELTHPRRRRDQVLLFDSIEEFHAWERREAIGR